MARTNLDIDDNACAEIMRRGGLRMKCEPTDVALRTLASEPPGLEEARKLRGTGWQGDLDDLRTSRPTFALPRRKDKCATTPSTQATTASLAACSA